MASQPEERVRQALVRWLIEKLEVPPRLIAVEYSLSALDPTCRHRADVVVWEPAGKSGGLKPWLLAECKAPGIKLDERVADQVRRYAERIKAANVLVTNGEVTRYFKMDGREYREISALSPFCR